MSSDRLIRLPEVLHLIGVSSATLYRWIGEGYFPGAVQLGKNSIGWRLSAVQGFIESRPPAATQPASGGRQGQEKSDSARLHSSPGSSRPSERPSVDASRRAR